MDTELVGRVLTTLPPDDDHPYRTGAWRPQSSEWRADDLTVTADLPSDLDGVYLRNTEGPAPPAVAGRDHPFDGDGMVHVVGLRDGRASCRNRFIRTDGFRAEQDAGRSLWAGLAEPPERGLRPDGWGARGRLKDSSSTDVVVHAGVAITSFYQCGDLYRLDPLTLDTLVKAEWHGEFPAAAGVPAHTKVDGRTGELLFFNYGTEPPFWDPALLADGRYAARFHPELPLRLAVVPRRGGGRMCWFEAAPTYVPHGVNAYEDGDEIVLDGFFQDDPEPPDTGDGSRYRRMFRFLALDRMQTRSHRWRLNLATGRATEERLTDSITEFGTIHPGRAGRRHRYVYAATGEPGWFLFDGLVRHDVRTGAEERYGFGPGVFGSEAVLAPRAGSRGPAGPAGEVDDGYLVTITSDLNTDSSECLVFDAASLADGPVARVALPERVSSGTHATWAAGNAIPGWDTAGSSIGLRI